MLNKLANTFEHMDDVDFIEHDGRVSNITTEPPAQLTKYIIPGKVEEESYRVFTFNKFPSSSNIDTMHLAANGFYYTGYKDRTKCFSCGVLVDDWKDIDDPKSASWHYMECEFYTNLPRNNIPMGYHIGQSNLPSPSVYALPRRERITNHTRRLSAESQFESARQTPAAIENSNEMGLTSNINALPSNEVILKQLFPCLDPVNPHMRDFEVRLATFEVGWPRSKTRASPKELAKSGMFCIGERDKLKCWYCNGGLQNWNFNDDPWFEHAKWFPKCEFVLQKKGLTFVDQILSQFPNIRRPAIRNSSETGQVLSGLNTSHSHRQRRDNIHSNSGISSTTPRQSRIPMIDSREDLKNVREKVNEEMENSAFVLRALEMGFEKELLKIAIERRLESSSSMFLHFEDLIDAVLNINEDESSGSESGSEGMFQASSIDVLSTISVHEQVRQMEEEKVCKVCRMNEVQVVFLPCAHLASCTSCSATVRTCPICHVAISDRIRTFTP